MPQSKNRTLGVTNGSYETYTRYYEKTYEIPGAQAVKGKATTT